MSAFRLGLLAIAAGAASCASPAFAGPQCSEGLVASDEDAGSLRQAAYYCTSAAAALSSVEGQLEGEVDVTRSGTIFDYEDMFLIIIDDPAGFTAHTCTGQEQTLVNTELWLFGLVPLTTTDALGLLANDDTSVGCGQGGATRSFLESPATDGSGAAIPGPGCYLLAISGHDRIPESNGGPIFADAFSTEISGPDGPGGPGAHSTWTGPGTTGSYRIDLTGTRMLPDTAAAFLDCNGNSIFDACDIAASASLDCNSNGTPDECDLAVRVSEDCNGNATPDECEAPSLKVSLGTRETGFAGSPVGMIGANGGASMTAGIEWLNKDGQTLFLDGTWQTFTWRPAVDPVGAFAGPSANGVLEGDYGTLEHLRFNNHTDHESVITLWVDLVENTIDPPGPPLPTTVVVQNFEGHTDNAEVMFQEPRFSGSTSGELSLTPNLGGVDNTEAFSGAGSGRYVFAFLGSADPTPPENWLRLTTFGGMTPQPGANPVIRYDQASLVTVRIKGIADATDCNSTGTLDICECGDWDGSGEADLADHAQLASCFDGPVASVPEQCLCMLNADFDTDIDLRDAAAFQVCFPPP